MSDEIDREIWDAAWHARMDRRLPDACKLDLSRYGKPTAVTIAANPPEFTDRGWRETDICPVCGNSTLNLPRIGAMLDAQFEDSVGLFIGVWAHSTCLEMCPVIGKAAHIPW